MVCLNSGFLDQFFIFLQSAACHSRLGSSGPERHLQLPCMPCALGSRRSSGRPLGEAVGRLSSGGPLFLSHHRLCCTCWTRRRPVSPVGPPSLPPWVAGKLHSVQRYSFHLSSHSREAENSSSNKTKASQK